VGEIQHEILCKPCGIWQNAICTRSGKGEDLPMAVSTNRRRLLDAYRFPFFRPLEKIRGIFGDSKARVISLVRRSKKQSATPAAELTLAGTTRGFDECFAVTVEK
jgi:hypothetical protein